VRVLDVDTHVIEPASVWDCLAASDEKYRPTILKKHSGGRIHAHFAGPKSTEFWVINDSLYGKHDADLIARYSDGSVTAGALTMENMQDRIANLNDQTVDVQLVFSSLFLNIRIADPKAELALTRAYNRWIAERCNEYPDRFKWIYVPSFKNISATIQDLQWAKDNGAVGILFRGVEGDKFISHTNFDPIYAKAEELDLPICVHIGHGSPQLEDIQEREGAGFNRFLSDCPNYFAFSTLITSDISTKFPKLRFGFFEAGSTWVFAAVKTALHLRLPPEDLMAKTQEVLEEFNFYITCELHEDLPTIMKYTSEDRLMLGSDYGHPGDISDTIFFRQELDKFENISPESKRKFVSTNCEALFRF